MRRIAERATKPTTMTNAVPDGRHVEPDTPEIVFAIDETADERCPNRAIIADITRDDAWVAVDEMDTMPLDEWR